MSNATSKTLTLTEATAPSFWQSLCPELSVEGPAKIPPANLNDISALRQLLLTEGYVNEPDVLPRGAVEPVRACIQRLHERGIPTIFAFVYDETWLLFRALDPFLAAVLGADYRLMPGFWAWYVEPSDAAAGWGPHRDRPDTLDAQNHPQSLTLWLPLSHATPLNGCMYVVPMPRDETFVGRTWNKGDRDRGWAPQDTRALPATPGSLLSWNQALLHWGGRSSRLASEARCSISLEFQRGDRPPFEGRVFPPHPPLTFSARLGLIGKQMRQYEYHNKLSAPELRLLAATLEWKFFKT